MSLRRSIMFAAVVVFAYSFEASASPIFVGDFEVGDISQWSASQSVTGGLSVVTSPVDVGKYAGKVFLRAGDKPFLNQNSERAELVFFSNETEGTSSWWAWSMYVPSTFKIAPGWNVFTQWHQNNLKCPSPISFAFVNDGLLKIYLIVRGGKLDWSTCEPQSTRRIEVASATLDRWHHFVCNIFFSSSGGAINVWLDGKPVVREGNIPNIYTAESVFFKQGLYRFVGPDVTLYFDEVRYGKSLSDVTTLNFRNSFYH